MKFIALAIAALSGPLAAIASPCAGPCQIPSCPGYTFTVCHQANGTTKVHIKYTPQNISATTTVKTSSTDSVGAFGALAQPCTGQSWDVVQSCPDLCGSCI